MRKRRTDYLSGFIVNQYPIEKFKEVIIITLDIAEIFLTELEEGFNYDSSSIASYGKKYGTSGKRDCNKIESIYINDMREIETMKKFLNGYYNAFYSLNEEEKNVFVSTFIDKMTDLEIIDKYKTNSNQIRIVRKSAIVKFCLKSGINKFVNLI